MTINDKGEWIKMQRYGYKFDDIEWRRKCDYWSDYDSWDSDDDYYYQYKYDDYYAELECSRRVSDRRQLQRKCEAYIYDFPYGEIECSGSHFRDVERRCEVYMYSDEYGEIDC